MIKRNLQHSRNPIRHIRRLPLPHGTTQNYMIPIKNVKVRLPRGFLPTSNNDFRHGHHTMKYTSNASYIGIGFDIRPLSFPRAIRNTTKLLRRRLTRHHHHYHKIYDRPNRPRQRQHTTLLAIFRHLIRLTLINGNRRILRNPLQQNKQNIRTIPRNRGVCNVITTRRLLHRPGTRRNINTNKILRPIRCGWGTRCYQSFGGFQRTRYRDHNVYDIDRTRDQVLQNDDKLHPDYKSSTPTTVPVFDSFD